MPLSEHEQRLLEQMERALYAEDPKLASALRGADPRSNARRRVLLASVGFLVGIAVLMAGVVTQIWPISVPGFILMVASAFFALTSWRALPSQGESTVTPLSRGGRRSNRSRPGYMARLEERWNRRRDQNGR